MANPTKEQIADALWDAVMNCEVANTGELTNEEQAICHQAAEDENIAIANVNPDIKQVPTKKFR